MAKGTGTYKIHRLRYNWIACRLVACLLWSATAGVLAILTTHILAANSLLVLACFLILFTALLIVTKPWSINNKSVSSLLNATYPQLEESAELLISNSDNYTLLQQFQLQKIEPKIAALPVLPPAFIKPLKWPLLCLVLAIGLMLVAQSLHLKQANSTLKASKLSHSEKPEIILPQIESVKVIITPPAYTGKAPHIQDKFTIMAEEGAVIRWQIETNVAVRKVSILLNDHDRITLNSNQARTSWTIAYLINKPGFYQLDIDGKLSDLYQIQVIKDQAPLVHIKTPKQYTYIDAGEAPRSNLTATVTDDYGISNAMIYATVAKGNGEGIKFKEYKIAFASLFTAHNRAYSLQHQFNLPALNMEPGDQLYFYIEAEDTHQQKSRTDVYTVSIQDTAALLSMNGITTGVSLKPEFFRSERQIILDTEQLLKSRDSLSKDKFNSKSNELATDQKLLRLRYSKFLGEEDESDIEGPANNAELAKVENFNNSKMLLDAYTDKHDNAEDATFFEPAIKAQLKETLTEMWKAELQLRLYKPQNALPFEYKALRLLKDLQQKSRAYVAKTAYNPPPLKPEKRLTGDLNKIINPTDKHENKVPADSYVDLKKATQVLDKARLSGIINEADKHTLIAARGQLSAKAANQPAMYLKAISALSRLLSGEVIRQADIDVAEKAIQRALPASKIQPQSAATAADMGLGGYYFQNLKHRQ